ncbi:MAG: DUF393 domain-containing protein [Actinomycetota bacterium]|nr:DUF393 domain-containing protein [Actinomycetota bacterium]
MLGSYRIDVLPRRGCQSRRSAGVGLGQRCFASPPGGVDGIRKELFGTPASPLAYRLYGKEALFRVLEAPSAQSRPGVPQRYGLAPDDCRTAAWTFTPDGRWFRGAGAINAALATVVGNRLPLWIYQLPVIRWAQDAAYDWIARNRRLFPGVTPWCSTHPDAGCDADTSSTAALI